MLRIFFIVIGVAATAPAFAGDASGFDPAAIDQCLSQGDPDTDCAEAGLQDCKAYAAGEYTGDDPDFVRKHCLDAAHQAWEVKLTEKYQALLSDLEGQGELPELLRQMERSWIGFRDDLCAYEQSAGGEDGNSDIAAAQCLLDATVLQWELLDRLTEMGEEG